MDEKIIKTHGDDLHKMAAQPNTSSSMINLLNQLKTGVQPSESLLRTTKIGVIVNRLKQHKDPTVARTASDLVGKWRKDVGKGGDSKTAANGGRSSPANGSVGGRGTPSGGAETPQKGVAVKSEGDAMQGVEKSKVPPEQRSAKADEVNVEVTGDTTRDNCLKLMYDGLAFMSEDPPSKILPIATSIEAAAFSHLCPSSQISTPYRTKIRSLYQNLKSKSNSALRSRLLSPSSDPSHLSPSQFVTASPEELKSEKRIAEDKAMAKENFEKAMVAQEERSISTSLVCGKCKERKVSYSQAQTRSADEPMTTFCECIVCGNRWKFS
ncbi:MAG: RNA polymerase II elongation factor [Alyxoria varia]|nr:MAG: RNA polymerase II elongation factor [Alyxoria varia]